MPTGRIADTKRDRERSGRRKERQYRLRKIEDDVAALHDASQTTFETPMVASYTVPPDEEPMRMECWGLEESDYGIVLDGEDGEELAYIAHGSVVALEPA